MTHDHHAAAGVIVRDLVVTYPGGARAVDGVSIRVPAGGVLGLVGGNGAGKSTTMRALAGVLPATSGSVHVAGHDLTTRQGRDSARPLIGYCPDTGGLPPAMTPRECIGLALATNDQLARWPQALELAERLDLVRVLDVPTGSFSHGMARRTSVLLACLAATDGRVLLLDEAFDGVDALGAQVIVELIAKARQRGLSVVVSTHEHEIATQVCDQFAIMSQGRIVAAMPARSARGRRGKHRYTRTLQAAQSGPAR